jgi:uncharacterized protein YxjI
VNYPLAISFKILSLLPQVKISDAAGQVFLYVKQKFALKTAIKIFADENQQKHVYDIAADKALGVNFTYSITAADGSAVGALKQMGMKSIWKANYPIVDATGTEIGAIHEENPWIKVLDALLSDIPFVSMFINPAYLVDVRGKTVLRIKKVPAMMEGKFAVEKKGEISAAEENLLMPAMIMFMMIERLRG